MNVSCVMIHIFSVNEVSDIHQIYQAHQIYQVHQMVFYDESTLPGKYAGSLSR